MINNKLLTIVGPTATGKTDLALKIAGEIKGELVSCDSRQVYIGLDLISGKISGLKFQKYHKYWEIDGIKVWMLDMVSPQSIYNVSDYIRDGRAVVRDIWSRGKTPIVVGGTGYYLKGLLEEFSDVGVPINPDLRSEIESWKLDLLQERLAVLSPRKWMELNNSDRQNKVRLIRAIEIAERGKEGIKLADDTPLLGKIDLLQIGLDVEKELLNDRIKRRLDERLKDGMIEEARKILSTGITVQRMKSLGLECRYLVEYLNGEIDLEQMRQMLTLRIVQYAKRQKTWFKRDKRIDWFDISRPNWREGVEKRLWDWYN